MNQFDAEHAAALRLEWKTAREVCSKTQTFLNGTALTLGPHAPSDTVTVLRNAIDMEQAALQRYLRYLEDCSKDAFLGGAECFDRSGT